jgi:hypothetical protein
MVKNVGLEVIERLPDLVSAVTVSGIFTDSRSAYIVSFFSDFMSVFYK